MKFKDLVGSLFTSKQASVSGVASKQFIKKCVGSDPEDLHKLIEKEQKELEREVVETTEAIQFRMKVLMQKIKELPLKSVQSDLETIRAAQDELRRLMRRYAASAKHSLELERELELWQQRMDEEGALHADHPKVRSEIIRSELLSRGITVPERQISKPQAIPISSKEVSSTKETDRFENSPAFTPHPDTAYLIQAIREATKEAELWHAQYSENPLYFKEAIDQVRQVRDMHAALKKIDKSQGVHRDRVALAIRLRDDE